MRRNNNNDNHNNNHKSRAMRIKDFEEAIMEMGGMTIDEMRMYHGQVRECFGHNDKYTVRWDDTGRGFSIAIDNELLCGRRTVTEFEDLDYNLFKRDTAFDLWE